MAGVAAGTAISLTILLLPFHAHTLDPGEITAGHAAVDCVSCHEAAPGSIRQQIQANLAFIWGRRQTSVDFIATSPGNAQCVACHQRDDDPHAVHRFLEPRFVAALKGRDATQCGGCHREHQGRRVVAEPGFCASCHDDLALKDDPLDVPHRSLVGDARWTTCLGCHDYHANHARGAQRKMADRYDLMAIEDYLAHGPDPYGSPKRRPAREVQP